MPPSPCALCNTNRALILRPKNHQKLCKSCFIQTFEDEIHHTVTSTSLFRRGETIAIGASGGKDSTVLASVLKTLNERHDYGLNLVLLSIDEGIKGYRDDSLETVKRNAVQYDMPLTIVGYGELYGWTMDQVVEQVGKRGNCTYCGVFRRQALDRGAAMLGIQHVVTGHNADDVAETVMMNLLRGDLPRLSRTTSIVTSTPSTAGKDGMGMNIKRSKPLIYAYEKEIVLYAHHKRLDYFSTECIYSPEAFRGSARAMIKDLERIRPSAILDIVRSGEDMAKLVPGQSKEIVEEDGVGGCSSAQGKHVGSYVASKKEALAKDNAAREMGLEAEVKDADVARKTTLLDHIPVPATNDDGSINLPLRSAKKNKNQGQTARKAPQKQRMGQCERCGYLSSQAVCKACVLLEGLNKNRPKTGIDTHAGHNGVATVANG